MLKRVLFFRVDIFCLVIVSDGVNKTVKYTLDIRDKLNKFVEKQYRIYIVGVNRNNTFYSNYHKLLFIFLQQ